MVLGNLEFSAAAIAWSCVAVVASVAISLGALAVVLLRLPADYFRGAHSPRFWSQRHPALRWLGIAGKNLLGLVLVLLGMVLSLPAVPGQGLLTILLGVMLLDFPGKRRLEQKLVSQPKVLRAINWLRTRYGRPPLVLDAPSTA